jgi:hypothetical protein
MDYFAQNASFAKHLHIPEILVQAAILDHVLTQLIQVHVEGEKAYTPESCETETTFNEELYVA